MRAGKEPDARGSALARPQAASAHGRPRHKPATNTPHRPRALTSPAAAGRADNGLIVKAGERSRRGTIPPGKGRQRAQWAGVPRHAVRIRRATHRAKLRRTGTAKGKEVSEVWRATSPDSSRPRNGGHGSRSRWRRTSTRPHRRVPQRRKDGNCRRPRRPRAGDGTLRRTKGARLHRRSRSTQIRSG